MKRRLLWASALILFAIVANQIYGNRLCRIVWSALDDAELARIDFSYDDVDYSITNEIAVALLVDVMRRSPWRKASDYKKRNVMGTISVWGKNRELFHIMCCENGYYLVNRHCFISPTNFLDEARLIDMGVNRDKE